MEEKQDRISSLIQSLSHPDKRVIREAADALISLAREIPELVERLDRLLTEAPYEHRWPIAYILAHFSPPSSLALRVLMDTLDHRDPDLRWAMEVLLVRLGQRDPGVATMLLDLLKSGTATQRRMAVYCLRDLEVKDQNSLQGLLDSLHDGDPLVRVATATSLKTRDDIGKEGLDSLLQLFLTDPDPRVRYTAALTLAQLGAPTSEIRAALEDAAQSPDPQLKKAASAALLLLKKGGPTSSAKPGGGGGPPVD